MGTRPRASPLLCSTRASKWESRGLLVLEHGAKSFLGGYGREDGEAQHWCIMPAIERTPSSAPPA